MTHKSGAANAPQASSVSSDSPHVDRVQADFEAELRKNGVEQTFQWMHIWFDKVARAIVEDELTRVLGDMAQDPQARALAAMDRMMPLATGISNHSTSVSANLMREAKLAALANIVDYDFGKASGYGSRAHRSEAWDALRVKRAAPKAPKTA